MEPGYLTVADLKARGWTRGLVRQYLGLPDRLFPVDHWLNWSGKGAWLIDWVELTEMTQCFEAGFLRSARIRRLPRSDVEVVIERIIALRERSPYRIEQIEESWRRRMNACVAAAAEAISDARSRGYRTPHKC